MKRYKNRVGLILPLIILISVGIATPAQSEVEVNGFVEGLWTGGVDDNNVTDRDYTAAETRLQLRLESYGESAEAFAKLDFVQDGFDSTSYDWEVREAYLKFRLPIGIDFKIGRQILTWGTGDLLFINDVFAKDYQSFFIGRQDQYLKAPQTALRAEWYNRFGSFAIVLIPDFEPNIIPTGDRLSFYNPLQMSIVGSDGYMPPVEPDNNFDNTEIAFRYSRSIAGFSFAGYAYRGFYKDPRGYNPVDDYIYFPRLNVYGSSLRGQIAGGIVWLEGGYYDSREDVDGDNYFVENSSIKGFVGFEKELMTDFTANLQFQVEQMVDYESYVNSQDALITSSMLPPNVPRVDEQKTMITSRLRKQVYSQTVTFSLFGFYSPSDKDSHIRFSAEYKYSDELSLMAGGNVFDGDQPSTSFGQFDLNDNVYLKVNYGF